MFDPHEQGLIQNYTKRRREPCTVIGPRTDARRMRDAEATDEVALPPLSRLEHEEPRSERFGLTVHGAADM